MVLWLSVWLYVWLYVWLVVRFVDSCDNIEPTNNRDIALKNLSGRTDKSEKRFRDTSQVYFVVALLLSV